MPNNILTADINFPTFTAEQSTEEKLDVVTNYLYMLMEQLRYTMGNLGAGNFNDAELSAIGVTITKPVYIDLETLEGNLLDLAIATSGLSGQIEDVAGNVSKLELTAANLSSRIESAEEDISSIDQYAKSITLSVSNGDTSSTIKLLAGGVQIASQIIKMDGLVTFTGLEDGSTTINGGCIQTGTIDAEFLNLTGAITFTDLSSSVQGDISDALLTANDAYDLAYDNQLPGYIHNTYISSTEIRSPTIIAGEFIGNEFNVAPESGNSGSFNIYGNTSMGSGYHMLEISYYWGTGAFVDFDSPSGAMARWNFSSSRFTGNIDFSGANVEGLYLTFS